MMKRCHYVFFIAIFLWAWPPPAVRAAVFEEGFSGIRWGAEISELPAFESFRGQDGVEFFRTPDKVYTIFDVDVEDVIFGFFEKKFFSAFVQIQSMDVYTKLREHLNQAYGKPEMKLTMNTEQTIYIWKAKDINIKLKIREKDGLMKLGVYYSPISRQVNEKTREMYFDSSPKFFPIERDKKPERIPIFRF